MQLILLIWSDGYCTNFRRPWKNVLVSDERKGERVCSVWSYKNVLLLFVHESPT